MPQAKKTGTKSTQGGTSAQHAEAGKQSHKNTASKAGDSKSSAKK